MKTTLAVLFMATFLGGCGLFAGAVVGSVSDIRWVKADPSHPVETLTLTGDVDEAVARVERRPAGILAIHERTPGAADALAAALGDAGLDYRIVAASAPYGIGPAQGRAVLLALEPDPEDQVTSDNPQSGVFDHAAPGADGLLRTRAWASIDVDIDDRRLRIIAADLETDDPEARAAWRFELETGPGATQREVIYSFDLVVSN